MDPTNLPPCQKQDPLECQKELEPPCRWCCPCTCFPQYDPPAQRREYESVSCCSIHYASQQTHRAKSAASKVINTFQYEIGKNLLGISCTRIGICVERLWFPPVG